MDIEDTFASWRIADDVWKATLPAFISEHQCPNKDNPSLMDTAIEIPACQFYHKVHPLVFITPVSVLPIVGMIRASVPAPFMTLHPTMMMMIDAARFFFLLAFLLYSVYCYFV
jgi:hypothetical protein